MQITETFMVSTPIEKLYNFFLDAPTVGTCVPGCKSVEMVNENEYDSIIQVKVGAISAKFNVRTKISETVPFKLIRTEGNGKELRNLGHFKQKTEINLKELSVNETEISYTADVSIVGRLGTFGDRIMKSKAKTLGKEFADAVRVKLDHKEVHGAQDNDLSAQKESLWSKMIRSIMDMIGRIFKSNKDI